MKRLFVLIMAALLLCTSCGRVISGVPVPSGETAGELSIFGSSSMTKLMSGLGEGYARLRPGVNFSVGGNGSSEAAPAVRDGTALFGMLSRELNTAESGDDIGEITVARDGLAIVVNRENPVDGLSAEQAGDIFAGRITNWHDVGGNDAKIMTMGRDEASGSRTAFESALGLKKGEAVYRSVYDDNSKIRSSVALNKYAVGYISLSAADGSVKALSVDGVQPCGESIKNSDYKLWRPFILIYGKNRADPLINGFLDYIKTDEARSIIISNGAVPVL